MAFSADGTGWFAESHGSALRLRVRPPDRAASALLTGRIVPLDDAFHAGSTSCRTSTPTRTAARRS